MIRHVLAGLAAAVLATSLVAAPAAATTSVCEVAETPDGFAALRASPSPEAREIARMRTGHIVVMQVDQSGEVIRRGRWTKVMYWPGGDHVLPSQPAYRTGRTGWVASRLIDICG
jgi:hypothetical protein